MFFLIVILGIGGERRGEEERDGKRKRVIIERRGNVDVDVGGAPPCKAGVVSKWQMVRLR